MATDRPALTWLPRAVAMAFTLFVSMFAMDAFDDEHDTGNAMDMLMHLAPSLLCLGVIILAWSREWIGALVFVILALIYAIAAWDHPGWIALISGPMLVIAVLYIQAWRHRRRTAR